MRVCHVCDRDVSRGDCPTMQSIDHLIWVCGLIRTVATPSTIMPSSFAAALETSMILSPTNGPRSLTRTVTSTLEMGKLAPG